MLTTGYRLLLHFQNACRTISCVEHHSNFMHYGVMTHKWSCNMVRVAPSNILQEACSHLQCIKLLMSQLVYFKWFNVNVAWLIILVSIRSWVRASQVVTWICGRHHDSPALKLWSPFIQRNSIFVQVQNALSRKGKEVTVEKLTTAFEESTAVFGIKFKKLSVCHFLCIYVFLHNTELPWRTSEDVRESTWQDVTEETYACITARHV